MNWKRNSKKYIAGILTIALAVGAGQSYGSMEVSAQERTLPGIEKLVQDTVASSDGTFHILEIVPSKENATIGYLAGGEEPVSEGRKLSEMPSATERQTAMDSLDAAKFPTTGPVTFSAYSESTGASRTEDVRDALYSDRTDPADTITNRSMRSIVRLPMGRRWQQENVITDTVHWRPPETVTGMPKA